VFATAEQLRIVAGALPEDWRIAVWLMRGCGLRIGEALAVKRENVRGNTLRIEEQRLGSGELGPLKHRRPGEYRDVPLPGYLAAMIAAHSSDIGIRDGNGESRYLLPPAIKQWRFRYAWRIGANKAGLPDSFTPHSLRHTWTSVMLASGIPITDVSRWLGHRDINLTHRIYGHLIPATVERASDAIDREFAEWSG
jgi:integrase